MKKAVRKKNNNVLLLKQNFLCRKMLSQLIITSIGLIQEHKK